MLNPRVWAAKEKMEKAERAVHQLIIGPRTSDFRFEHANLVAELQKAMDEYLQALIDEGKERAGG